MTLPALNERFLPMTPARDAAGFMRLLSTYILNLPRQPLLGALGVVVRTSLAAGQKPYTWHNRFDQEPASR